MGDEELSPCVGCGTLVPRHNLLCESCKGMAHSGVLNKVKENLESASLSIHKALIGLALIGEDEIKPQFGFDSIRPGQTVEDGDFPK